METTKKRGKISTKIILMFTVLLVIVMVAIGYVTYKISYSNGISEQSDGAL